MVVKRSFEELPPEIQTEILLRLPLKTLVKCICASKTWASRIRTKEFKNDYLSRSVQRPRMMFLVYQPRYRRSSEVLFQSVYEEEEPLLSSGQEHVLLSQDRGYVASPLVRGLICLREKKNVIIFNPGTNKCHHLPEIPVPIERGIMLFLGYDELTDVYKVLCIAVWETRKRSKRVKEQGIFTMGLDEVAWRRITCEHDQYDPVPNREGLCTGGVLYYRAWSDSGKGMMMRFNVRSEEFSVIELPGHGWDLMNNNDRRGWELVNYNGAVALVDGSGFSHGVVNESSGNKVFHIFVRNEVRGNWSREPIEIPRFREAVASPKVYFFRGTTKTRKLVFLVKDLLPKINGKRSVCVVCYDPIPKTRDLRRFKIEGGEESHCVRIYLDHVDTPIFI
ncbi:hypothetical protein CARUB_v10021343mg [Capsella rubella]|uniref:F-box domain-containing protein n=1 Tax=Capsella rubella TaxID=81985 RepID=R0IB54_9BRAS|nr:putative F-box protein At1g70960 [Capsella rubella]EOA33853.1 hypothetical protein CARUB_v10021343mg [Capsella rubella]